MNRLKFNNPILPLTDSLNKIASSIIHNTDVANDTAQDLLLKLHEIRAELSEVDNVKEFVFRSLCKLK